LQVWGVGGGSGKAGSQCHATNYSYPWRDNYCETRSWPSAFCPAGTGHQGQDIRPATCSKATHWAVAAADGTITNVGSYSVYVLSTDGKTRFDYLHMSDVAVRVGAKVKRGARLGKVSNVFNGTPTTIHLHFNIRRNLPGLGWTFVPPYTALVDAYQRQLEGTP
jgi:murein DD-endopeptidase MepM/ murein hydrolase activator NlpD